MTSFEIPVVKVETQAVVHVRKRASNPKARTGCLTCKARRVKCDEAKPGCLRCLSYAGKCSGYMLQPKIHHLPSGLKFCLPNMQPLCRSPVSRLFSNEQEYGYFRHFCEHTVGELTGCRGLEFWTRVVLQASDSKPCIRYAATALGALNFKILDGKEDESERIRREFAFSVYQKSIISLRKALAMKHCDVRTQLISCILFACFESYHGDNKTALSQLYAGIEMMEEYRRRRKTNQITSYTQVESIDKDIVNTFNLLEIQGSAWGDHRSPAIHRERIKSCAEQVENMPVVFNDIRDAGWRLSSNLLRGIHWRHAQAEGLETPPDVHIPPFIGLTTLPIVTMESEREVILATFDKWKKAFEPIYMKARSPQGKHLLKGAILLRMHCVGSTLWVASGTPGAYRHYTKEMWELLELSKELICLMCDDPFSFNIEVVLPLAVVGWTYRNRAVRREAIEILSSLNRRETIWDAAMIAEVLGWIAEIEEEGLDEEEYVPEDVVATIVDMKINATRKSVFVSCRQGIKGSPGKTVLKETTVYW